MQHRARPAVESGLLIVDKPGGMTSHDVVSRIRRIMGTRKVGHAGTLDPIATGVLVVGIERATKLLGHLALDRKSYRATIALGAATHTDDSAGEALRNADESQLGAITEDALDSAITEDALDSAIAELTGNLWQVPSAVSAVKIDGVRAYERARAGEHVELPPRPVTVHRFDRLALRRNAGDPARVELDVDVDCSSGTYVRALARDLGAALGVGGHLSALRRTSVGPFGLADARTLEQLSETPTVSLNLDESVATAFHRRPVDEATARAVRHGQRVPEGRLGGTYAIVDQDGHALALATDEAGRTKLLVVLDPA